MRPVESLFFVVAEIWFWCGHINKLLLLEIQYSPNMGDSRCRPVGAIRSIAIRSSGRHCDLVHAQVCPAPCIATFRSASSWSVLNNSVLSRRQIGGHRVRRAMQRWPPASTARIGRIKAAARPGSGASCAQLRTSPRAAHRPARP